MQEEQKHLEKCKEVIRKNIEVYKEKVVQGKKEREELHTAFSSGDVELYNQLIVSEDLLAHNENMLRKNNAALEKPYFGRVDYIETGTTQSEQLYIGKNGISKNRTEVFIVDWRAPVSTIYYENELGAGSYYVPEVGEIKVDLQRKRTFDINKGELLGYYDNDTVATDELLVKYLSQNKDVILGDIISTIQKEQNEIIRESPYMDVIVQGVAGSGKTTVAMHRISYILYNYEEKFAPGEFCIIGGSDMLLHYITSGLPELDVYNVGQKRMDVFFKELLERENKKDFSKIFGKGGETFGEVLPQDAQKSRMSFINLLEAYLLEIKERFLPVADVTDEKLGVLMPESSIADTLRENPEISVMQLAKILNERLQKRITFLMTEEERAAKKKEVKEKYKGYFYIEKEFGNIINIYRDFLEKKVEGAKLPQAGAYTVYDLAALVLIWKRVIAKKTVEDFGQIIVDEAQDFGTAVYYVLKQVLCNCHFTIMGDVSQNINYETGMNSWEEMKTKVFSSERMRFHILAKSYRNTIEISEYAGKILDKASFGRYKITPVIRHGRKVEFYKTKETKSKEAMAEQTRKIMKEVADRGFDTIAVICRNATEAKTVRKLLGIQAEAAEAENFGKGVMVLPIELTKGLEFDAVILWNPSETAYKNQEADAKLLYVAITRALHELHIVYDGKLSDLFTSQS